MNILHMKYAIEVAKSGSLNKAAQELIIAQPNLSRSIKELESDLGIIFERSAKGMQLTPDGEKFINYAKDILKQIDSVEMMYKSGLVKKQRFSISVPRACYISMAFADFSQKLSNTSAEIFYKETNTQQTINNVLGSEYKLRIIRYAENYDKAFKTMLDEKGLNYELISEFCYHIIMSQYHPLAQKNITFADLTEYIEISHADPYMPSLVLSKAVKEEILDNISRHIYIFERASQFDLLSENHKTFMWVSPAPDKVLERYHLVQKNVRKMLKLIRMF